jgi:hypothetical protein
LRAGVNKSNERKRRGPDLLGKWLMHPLITEHLRPAENSQNPGLVQQSLLLIGSTEHIISRSTVVIDVPPHFGIWIKWTWYMPLLFKRGESGSKIEVWFWTSRLSKAGVRIGGFDSTLILGGDVVKGIEVLEIGCCVEPKT